MERPTDNLIYNRTSSDVQRVAELNRKISKGEATAEEVQEWFQSKGALNHTDLNRIETWTEFLSNYLKSYGYNAPIKKRAERTYIPQMAPVEVESVLPEGYIQLSYIESTGTQYVDTGFKPNQDTRVVADIYFDGSKNGWLFGARNGSKNGAFGLAYTGLLRSDYNTEEVSGAFSNFGRILIDKNKETTFVNGVSFASSTYSNYSTNYNLYLFNLNSAGSLSTYAVMRVYSSQIYDNGTLVRDYIPCRSASGDIGLFDTVTQTFFGNAGTGVFLPGEVVATLPEGHERAFYIQATGEQYIDTGFKPNQDTRVTLDMRMTAKNSDLAANGIMGARTSTRSKAFAIQWNTANDYFQHFYNNGYDNLDFGEFDVRQIMEMNKNVLLINGTSHERTYADFQCDYPLYLFCLNNAGTAAFYSMMRIYACQIYDNGVLIRNFIPCKNSSGEFGLFDLVEQKFYGNAGTGAFLGTVVRKLPEGYTQVDYIESSGTQYVDTGFAPDSNSKVMAKAEFTGSVQYPTVYGVWDKAGTNAFIFLCLTKYTKARVFYGTIQQDVDCDLSGVLNVIQDKNVFYVNGDKIAEITPQSFACLNTLHLFSNNNSGAESNLTIMKLYSCQIYDNGILIRDYVPCINAQRTVGLYDVKNDVFYTNAGTGTFATGEEISIPEGGGGVVIPNPDPIVYSDWREWDIPYLTEINRIRDNVNAIQKGFYSLSDWRDIEYKNNPNFEDINTLEWDLQSIYQWLNLMVLNFTFSGEIYAGEVW